MLIVHTAPTAVEIHNLKNVLETEGIACEVRGEFRRAAIGELPVNECWIELWVVDDRDAEKARRIIGAPAEAARAPWNCPECDEIIEGQFELCWNCRGGSPKTIESGDD